jgi:hypothetical protein
MWRIRFADDTMQTKREGPLLASCKGEHLSVWPNWKTQTTIFREEQECILKDHTLHHVLFCVLTQQQQTESPEKLHTHDPNTSGTSRL